MSDYDPSPEDEGIRVVPEIPQTVSKRCTVCQHEYRAAIDRAIVSGTPHTDVAETFGVSRKGVGNHAKEHLSINDASLQRIIEREARLQGQVAEEGVQGAIRRRVLLESYLDSAMQGIVDGVVRVDPKDAVNIVALLDKLDNEASAQAVDEIRLQFNAILQAINELIPGELKEKVSERAKDIARSEGYGLKSIEPEISDKPIPETIDAEVEEDN